MGFEGVKALIAEWVNGIKSSGGRPVEHTVSTANGMYEEQPPVTTADGKPIVWDVRFPHKDGSNSETLVGRVRE